MGNTTHGPLYSTYGYFLFSSRWQAGWSLTWGEGRGVSEGLAEGVAEMVCPPPWWCTLKYPALALGSSEAAVGFFCLFVSPASCR